MIKYMGVERHMPEWETAEWPVGMTVTSITSPSLSPRGSGEASRRMMTTAAPPSTQFNDGNNQTQEKKLDMLLEAAPLSSVRTSAEPDEIKPLPDL